MSNALPLPPRPNLEQYKKLARDLQDACKSTDPDAIRQWAARWLENLARLHGPASWPAVRGRENEPEDIEHRWNKLKERTAHMARCALAGTQFFVARTRIHELAEVCPTRPRISPRQLDGFRIRSG